jgi:predicted DCC family thiol-disulfide oxidoreductase YuxK
MGTAPTADETDPKAVVLYDGMCPFCRRGVRILARLDWLGRLRYQDARDTARRPACEVPLDPKRLLEEMHVVTPDRKRAYAGYRAFRWMAWRLPPLWPLAPLMYVPGMLWLGNRAYLWVARHRFDLVPCEGGVCQLHRPGERR